MGVEIFLIAFLIGLSAVYSATETALLSLPKARVLDILKERNDRPLTLRLWIDKPNRILTAILVGNNFVNILASSVATEAVSKLMSQHFGINSADSWSIAIAVGIMTLLILTFGEVVPKTFAKHNPQRILPVLFLTYWVYWIFRPFVEILMMITRPTVRAAGGVLNTKGPTVSEQEIETMIRIGADEGVFSVEKEELYESILDFSTTQAKEVMTPRTDIKGFPVDSNLEEMLEILDASKFSRYPVYDGDPDHILGILLAKDLLRAGMSAKGGKVNVRELLHQAYFVPETKKIGELLKEFQTSRNQLAIVVDEWGGTSGLVTVEDVLEEIVGEIYDESDKTEQNIKPIAEGRYLVSAKAPIEDVAEELSLKFPEQDDYETIGGFFMTMTGKVPRQGDVIVYKGAKFTVRERTKTRIISLEVQIEAEKGKKKEKK